MTENVKDAFLLGRQDLRAAVGHFEIAAKASRQHTAMVERLIKLYGDGNGRQISGVIRDHFPEASKRNLLALCKTIRDQNDKGMAQRPKGVHKSTMYALARAVCRRDGHGFYGFRA